MMNHLLPNSASTNPSLNFVSTSTNSAFIDSEHTWAGPEDPSGSARYDGWLIAQKSDAGRLTGRYLQIATGQWGPTSYATLFTLQSTAIAYAKEFGFRLGRTVDVVPRRRTGT